MKNIIIAVVVVIGIVIVMNRPGRDQATVDSLNAYIRIADSLKILAHLPPDTVTVIDTVYLEPREVISVPDIQVDSSALITVRDTLEVDGEINAWIEFQMRGQLESGIKWRYRPIVTTKTITIKQPVPYPVIETMEISVPSIGHYLSLSASGNDKMILFGVWYDLVRDNNMYGVGYQRFGDNNLVALKLGIRIFK